MYKLLLLSLLLIGCAPTETVYYKESSCSYIITDRCGVTIKDCDDGTVYKCLTDIKCKIMKDENKNKHITCEDKDEYR